MTSTLVPVQTTDELAESVGVNRDPAVLLLTVTVVLAEQPLVGFVTVTEYVPCAFTVAELPAVLTIPVGPPTGPLKL